MMNHYDVAIIGHGVSGLSLGSVLNHNIKSIIIDFGKKHTERDPDDSTDSAYGLGGAGLYSDGKFSFWPSGTRVWDLSEEFLSPAYQSLVHDLSPFLEDQINDCRKPSIMERTQTVKNDINQWRLKPYPSHYLGLSERMALIDRLMERTRAETLPQNFVNFESIRKKNKLYRIPVKNLQTNERRIIWAQYLVLAGGRYMPLYCDIVPKVFRRIEFGARIASPSETEDMIQDGLTDPKFIFKIDGGEIRSFCWCKEGEVVLTNNLQGIKTYSGKSISQSEMDLASTSRKASSGRADNIKKSNQSNFGLNIILNQEEHCDDFNRLLSIEPFQISYHDVVLRQKIIKLMGKKYGGHFLDALDKLIEKFPSLANSQTQIIGPTIEGVGYYPNINKKTLKVVGENIYCCGDATGIFRGIVPSMVSGYFVAHTLNKILQSSFFE